MPLRYLRLGLVKGESHFRPTSRPKTDFRLAHLLFFSHLASSFFSVSIWVSSVNMADICVQNITMVNMPKSRDSKPNMITKIKVVAGEKLEHSVAKKMKHLLVGVIEKKTLQML